MDDLSENNALPSAILPLNASHRTTLKTCVRAVLLAADPVRAVREALASYPLLGERVLVVGAGKAGERMAEGALAALGSRIKGGWLNVKGDQPPSSIGPLTIHPASHPLPDERGLAGTEQIVRLAQSEADSLLVLISGGGSALLELPASPLTLSDLQATTDLLLRAGADIHQLNAVRKHLSQVKGGGLARLAAPTNLLTLAISDVVGDDLAVIASGPTVPDPTTFADALAVLDRFALRERVPEPVLTRLQAGAAGNLEETAKIGDPAFSHARSYVIASNQLALNAALVVLRSGGYSTARAPLHLSGEAREFANLLAAYITGAVARKPANWGLLFGGETTVQVQGSGRGGRNQELALAFALALDSQREKLMGRSITLASLATDGDDGSGGAAGAIADQYTVQRAAACGLDAGEYLANNDSYSFWQRLAQCTGGQPQIVTGLSGTNVNDIVIVLVS